MSDTDQPASSEPEEPQTPQRNSNKQRPTQQLSRSDSETDPGYRSRSQSRRARRRKQQKGGQQTNPKENLMPAVEENQEEPEDPGSTMQPFEMIGTDETSMNGPVTYAKAQRGEIPKRPGNPEQQLATGPKGGSGGDSSGMMDQDGLKLRIELNLDIEIELKASIHGDITLALL